MMMRWAAKVISMFAIFFLVFGSMLLPIKVYGMFARQGAKGVHLISCLMCFGGGVFLGVYMLHMAPDVRNIFDEALFHPRRITYPVADCVMVAGFFMMVFFSGVIKHIRIQKTGDEDEEEDDDEEDGGDFLGDDYVGDDVIGDEFADDRDSRSSGEGGEKRGKKLRWKRERKMLNPANCIKTHESMVHDRPLTMTARMTSVTSAGDDTSSTLSSPRPTDTPSTSSPSLQSRNCAELRRPSVFGYEMVDGMIIPLRSEQKPAPNDKEHRSSTANRREGGVEGGEDAGFQRISKTTTAGKEYTHIELAAERLMKLNKQHHTHADMTRSLTLLFALSLHNVFEGLSIGLKQTVSSVWNVSIAVLAHEVVIAFSLGMQMVNTYRSVRKIVLAAAMCSSMVPLGMLIGLCVTETGQHNESVGSLILNGTLQGLATGVFIYVTFFEILRGELGHGKSGIDKMFFMLGGFVLLALLALVPDDMGYTYSHFHDHDGNGAGSKAYLDNILLEAGRGNGGASFGSVPCACNGTDV